MSGAHAAEMSLPSELEWATERVWNVEFHFGEFRPVVGCFSERCLERAKLFAQGGVDSGLIDAAEIHLVQRHRSVPKGHRLPDPVPDQDLLFKTMNRRSRRAEVARRDAATVADGSLEAEILSEYVQECLAAGVAPGSALPAKKGRKS